MTRTEFCTLMKLTADKTAKAELVAAAMLPDANLELDGRMGESSVTKTTPAKREAEQPHRHAVGGAA